MSKECDYKVMNVLEDLTTRYPVLEQCKDSIFAAFDMMRCSFRENGKLLVAGNGGSAADAEHIVGELMKSFVKTRPITPELKGQLQKIDDKYGFELGEKLQGALPAISLVGHPGLSTAYLNDVDPVLGFAQQVNGFGQSGDVLLAISTSGDSKNILYAMVTAKAKGMKVIGLTGRNGGEMKRYVDISIIVGEQETYKIQELHLPVYHALCLMLEEEFFS